MANPKSYIVLLNMGCECKLRRMPRPKTFDVFGSLTKTQPRLRELVGDTFFGVNRQQKRLMLKWAKKGYELFVWGTGVMRRRRIAQDYAREHGFNPYDIHAINVANYTLWFGKPKK